MNFNENENEVTDFNTEEMQWNPYAGAEDAPGGMPEEYDVLGEATKKKMGFWEKHKYAMGILSGIALSVIFLAGVFAGLRSTGSYFIIGGNGLNQVENSQLLDEKTVSKLNEIYEWMRLYYYETYEITDIQENLYDAVIGALNDPYSVYYTKQEYQDLMVSTSGVYYGIGAGLQQDKTTMEVTVSKVYRGTPAEEAGLMQEDKILSVEGIDATSIDLSDLVQKIRGEEGTKVHMVIYRPSTDKTFELDVERRNVELPSVEGELLDGGIGYVQVTEFQEKTAAQFELMVEELKLSGMKGLIIDLRANPGGLLTTVTQMCDYVLPEGMITYIEDKYGNRQEYKSNSKCLDLPIVVLIDGNSASASEIFAGAMKDYQYATLVGKNTFGKGIVQNVIRLSDGDAIKLTTAKYFTPNGNYIHGVGIAPDVEVEYEYNGPENEPYDKQYDSQFLKGLEVLREMLK